MLPEPSRRRARWARGQSAPSAIRPYEVPGAVPTFTKLPQEAPDATKAVVGECPHCGRKLGKGGHFHIKACKASPNRGPGPR